MKVLIENHKENDKNLEEKLKREAEERHLETHTITCNNCGAQIHFYRENLKFNFDYNRFEKILNGASITCPCCNHSIKIPKNIAEEDYEIHRNKNYVDYSKHKIEVLKEGNFQIEMTCDNCESSFSFDYRDTFEKEITREVRDYYWNVHYISSKERFIKCPICGKEHPVKD